MYLFLHLHSYSTALVLPLLLALSMLSSQRQYSVLVTLVFILLRVCCMHLLKKDKHQKSSVTFNKRGVPVPALILTTAIGLFAFLTSFIGEGTAYTWIVNISGLCGFIVWVGIAVSHYRFRRAFIAQGRDLSELPLQSVVVPSGPNLGVHSLHHHHCWSKLLRFLSDTIDWYGVSVAYIGLPIFFAVYLGYKYIKKTKLVPLKEVNLDRDFDR